MTVIELVLDVIWNKVNAINLAIGGAAAWLQMVILVTLSSVSTGVAWWVQFGLGCMVSISLIAFNVLKFWREWKKTEEE